MTRNRNKTTVILVNKNQHPSKPIKISTSFIVHWKKYVTALFCLFFILIVGVCYLFRTNAANELINTKLKLALSKSKKQLIVVDTSTLKEHYKSIDKKLLSINRYLRARGVATISAKNAGGEANDDVLSNEEVAEFYDTYLSKVAYNVAYTPMGYPYVGKITSGFGHRENPFSGENVETHKGLDIRATYGEIVKSTANGKVIYAAWRGGYGNCVVIHHGNGFDTFYGHLSKILVANGQNVEAGGAIGKVGSTGRSTGPHVHYEVHKNGKVINPRSFLTLE